MSEKSSVFDMIGPVMVGPSSSHTAGVVRIGLVAHRILGKAATSVEITFFNSFARTYEGHGSDRAILAGLMGYLPDDERIKQARSIAEKELEFTFRTIGSASEHHPNTVRIRANTTDRKLELFGESLGGGVIRISAINGFDANFSGSMHTLIIEAHDEPGSIGFITSVISRDECNIANMTVSRKGKNDIACQIIEMDSALKPITLSYIRELSWVHGVTYLPELV